MFDISTIKALSGADAINDGLPMSLKHPITGEDTGAVWTIRSYESEAYKAIDRRKRTEGFGALRKGKINAGKLDDDEIAMVASLVSGWSGMSDNSGPLQFSTEAVIELFKIPIAGKNFMLQVNDMAEDNAAFFKASSKTSQTPSATKSAISLPETPNAT
jgi:hypothetical protein